MEVSAKAQRRRARRKTTGSSVIRIEMKDARGNQHGVAADLVDLIDNGLGLALTTPVNAGAIVIVRGKLGESHTADHVKAVVRWCVRNADGTFRAGLEFLNFSSTSGPDNSVHSDTLDCYEVMQLSPNADPDTISRIYRLLAARYHPDNLNTGNSEMFLRLSEAYQILSDPAKRASYDARRRETAKAKLQDARGVAIENRRGEGKGERFRRSVGALGGWDAALRTTSIHETRVWIA